MEGEGEWGSLPIAADMMSYGIDQAQVPQNAWREMGLIDEAARYELILNGSWAVAVVRAGWLPVEYYNRCHQFRIRRAHG